MLAIFEGAEIRALRKARHLSQNDLAEALGVDRSVLSRWEAGNVQPREGAARKLAEWMSLNADLPPTSKAKGTRKSDAKISVRLLLDAATVDAAREYGINFDEVVPKALQKEVDLIAAERWKRENENALEAMAERIAAEGVAGEEYRSFG